MKKCPHCAEKIQDEAKKCKHCGELISEESFRADKAKTAKQWLIFVVIFSVAMLVSKFYTEPEEQKFKELAQTSTDSISIASAAHVLVQRYLKAPSTAKFPRAYAHKITNLGNNQWQVSSYVDSQNSFGAMIRENYTIVIRDDGKDNWSVVNMEFAGK